jgi:hypothetical protein
MKWWLAVAVILTTVSQVLAQAALNQDAFTDDSSRNKAPLEIRDLDLLLESTDSETFRAAGNLGGLLANQDYRIHFQIKNPFDHDIEFESSRSTCNCTEVRFQQLTIPGRKSIQGTIAYRSPDFSKQGKIEFTLLLLRRSPPGAQNAGVVRTICMLNFSGYLRGVIDLGPPSHVFEVREQVDEYFIPIVITEPIKVADLEFKVSPELKDISAEIASDGDERIAVRIRAAKFGLPPSGIAGELTVSHRPSRTEKKLLLTVTPQLPIRLSPNFLAFSPSDQDDRIVEATAIIRINLPSEPSSDDGEAADIGDERAKANSRDGERTQPRKSPERLEIADCMMGEYRVEHQVYRISDSIWKVRFRMAKSSYDQFIESHKEQQESDGVVGRDVSFRIRVGDRQFEMQINLFEE